MKMKKLTALLLVAILALSFTACGNTAKNGQEQSDWAYVQDKGKLVIGVTDYPPMNYMDDSGKWTGFDTELAEAVTKKLGIEVEFIQISWSAKETELSSKNIDCLWNGMCITDERKNMWEVTDPYMNNTQAMVMKKDKEAAILKDVSGLNIVAEAGSTGEEKVTGVIDDSQDSTVKVIAKDYFANSKYTGVESMATALMDVENGVADVAVVDYVIALGMLKGDNSSFKDLVINTDNNFGAQYFGIAFRKGSDIKDKVNAALAELKNDGTMQKIAEKYGIADSLIK